MADYRFPEAVQIDMIRACEARYAEEFGAPPFDLSIWDSGDGFQAHIAAYLELPPGHDVMDYVYASALTQRPRIALKLGFDSSTPITVTPNATLSILFAAACLRNLGVDRFNVLTPAYFSVAHAARICGASVTFIPARRHSMGFRLELGPIDATDSAIWLSHPLFSAGTVCAPPDLDEIIGAADRGAWVVIDEALAPHGRSLHARLGDHRRIISIHSPHKSVCLNAFKFGAVVHPADLSTYFDRWSDVVYGGLGLSSALAIEHFLSAGFDQVASAADAFLAEAREFVTGLGDRVDGMVVDDDCDGLFTSCFFPEIAADLCDKEETMQGVMNATGASFIPGSRNRMPPTAGFSFRVNLTRDGPQFRAALTRLCRHVRRAPQPTSLP